MPSSDLFAFRVFDALVDVPYVLDGKELGWPVLGEHSDHAISPWGKDTDLFPRLPSAIERGPFREGCGPEPVGTIIEHRIPYPRAVH